jgi:hypothetical protein
MIDPRVARDATRRPYRQDLLHRGVAPAFGPVHDPEDLRTRLSRPG